MLRSLFPPALTVLLLLSSGCDRSKTTKESQAADTKTPNSGEGGPAEAKKPSAKEARKIAATLPPKERVTSIVNPKNREPYAGETGGLRGVVKAVGDKSPALPEVVAKMDGNCTTSKSVFGTLFREGPERELADVLVTVTGYDGFVPAKGEKVEVRGEGCAWDRRTIAMTFGQTLAIDGLDNRPYVPELLGQAMPAQLFVLPTAPEVQLPPQRPGRFKLVDSMRLYNVAEVFVLPYPTADVSSLDGEFEVKRIPVGEVTVNAFLPQTGTVVEKKVTIKAGEVTTLDFELGFDATAWNSKEKPVPLDEVPGPDQEPGAF